MCVLCSVNFFFSPFHRLPNFDLTVNSVDENSPASKAGLRVGDEIVTVRDMFYKNIHHSNALAFQHDV